MWPAQHEQGWTSGALAEAHRLGKAEADAAANLMKCTPAIVGRLTESVRKLLWCTVHAVKGCLFTRRNNYE